MEELVSASNKVEDNSSWIELALKIHKFYIYIYYFIFLEEKGYLNLYKLKILISIHFPSSYPFVR